MPVVDVESLAGGVVLPPIDGDLGAGRRLAEQVYRAAERAGDIEAMATAVLGLGGLWVHEQRGAAALAQLRARLRHVLSLLDPTPPWPYESGPDWPGKPTTAPETTPRSWPSWKKPAPAPTQ